MSRQGLKRVACEHECGCIAYMTLAQLERYGMPVCPCGAAMVPEDLEVAAHVLDRERFEKLPVYEEYARAAGSVVHGQASHRQRANGRTFKDPQEIAGERVAKARQAAAHARRLSGLVQYRAVAQAAADMPF